MTGHTPGPWRAKGAEVYCGRLRVCSQVNAADASLNIGGSVERSHANARLIAAAPDLLEALEGVIPYLEEDPDDEGDYNERIRTVRAAIAKAKG